MEGEAPIAKEEKKPVMTEEDSIIINVNDGVFIQTRFFQIWNTPLLSYSLIHFMLTRKATTPCSKWRRPPRCERSSRPTPRESEETPTTSASCSMETTLVRMRLPSPYVPGISTLIHFLVEHGGQQPDWCLPRATRWILSLFPLTKRLFRIKTQRINL